VSSTRKGTSSTAATMNRSGGAPADRQLAAIEEQSPARRGTRPGGVEVDSPCLVGPDPRRLPGQLDRLLFGPLEGGGEPLDGRRVLAEPGQPDQRA
jgi:hypothetical protein